MQCSEVAGGAFAVFCIEMLAHAGAGLRRVYISKSCIEHTKINLIGLLILAYIGFYYIIRNLRGGHPNFSCKDLGIRK